MKQLLTFLIALTLSTATLAQAPQKMSYQTVIRNATDDLLTEAPVGIQISILQGSPGGAAVYVESHSSITNINGLASMEIGMGTPVSGTFAGIDWGAGPYFIKSDIDPLGGTTYTLTGTSELLSVPYALYAANSPASGEWALDGDVLSTDKLVGIGTETPVSPLHVLDEGIGGLGSVFGQNTYEGTVDNIGVRGISVNAPGYGIGGRFEGGYRGVYALANSSTYDGATNALYASASGTAGTRRGVLAQADNLGGSTAYGVYGQGTSAATNYGVFGTASGGTNNWAGYFQGNVRVTSSPGMASEATNAQLHVQEGVGAHGSVIYGESTYEGNSNKVGVSGRSVNAPGYGYGGFFEGGYRGVYAYANSSTYNGTTYGLNGYATGTAGVRAGVYGQASNPGGFVAYGVRGYASAATTNFGVYGFSQGGTTNWAGYFVGNVRVTGTLDNTSDARLKKDISDMDNALATIKLLEPKTYAFRVDEYPLMGLDERPQLGFIAQDMEKVLPQLVRTAIHPGTKHDDREESDIPATPDVEIMSINYIGIIPLLTQGIKELSSEVEAKDEAIEALEIQVALLEEKVEIVEAMTIRMEQLEKALERLSKL